MAKTIFLHIGSPKTGSTSIQSWLAKNKFELEKNDILYPGSIKRHNFILSMVHPNPETLRMNYSYGRNYFKEDILSAELEKIDNEIRSSNCKNIIFSNENFFTMSNTLNLKELKSYLNKYAEDIKIIVYFRDPLKLLLSRSQEQIKSGVRTFEKVCNNPPVLNCTLVKDYIEIFGIDNLILLDFDSAVQKDNLIQKFINSIIPNLQINQLKETEVKNKGLSFEALLLISELNKEYGYKKDWDSRFIKYSTFEGIGNTKFSLPKESLEKVKDRIENQYIFLNDLGFNFKAPNWSDIKYTQPDWSFNTTRQLFELISNMSEALKNKDLKKAKFYVRNELIKRLKD